MKKIIVLAALAFGLMVGTTAVVTIHPQAAFADPGRLLGLKLLNSRETAMKKLIVLAALSFALVGGTATAVIVHSQPAMACDTSPC